MDHKKKETLIVAGLWAVGIGVVVFYMFLG